MAQIEQHWTVDRRVPLALIVTIILQSALGVWWAASITERITNVEDEVTSFNARNRAMDLQVNEQAREVAVLSAEIKNLTNQLERLYDQGQDTNRLLQQIIREGNGNGTPRP